MTFNRTTLYFLTLIVIYALCACTHIRPSTTVILARGTTFALILPTHEATLNQIVTGKYNNESHTLVMQIEIQSQHLVMAGMTPSGTRLFSAEFDGASVNSWKSPLFTAPFDGSFMIADFLLTSLDIQTLQAQITQGSIEETKENNILVRTIYDNKHSAIIRIQYGNAVQHDDGTVDYCHLERNYCIYIKNVEQ